MKSKIVIVDEKDNVIGYKDRDAVKQEDIYRVSALWITNDKGDILLARRSLTKSHDPGKWGPAVAGTVEQEEDYLTNICKEAEEEIGLKGIVPQAGPKERISGKYNYFVKRYLIKINKPEAEFVINKDEVEEIKWFKTEELLQAIRVNPDNFLNSTRKWIEIFCQ
ncbi:MAG: NUDIX domain-containing protein [Patescibacteria group bacterium]|jgi:isopentenyl-diphosphate delta-isomerase